MLKTTTYIILLFLLITSVGFSQSKKKEDRGLLPELKTNTNDDETDSKTLKSEVLISRTENKAIEALLNILKKKKGTPQEADYLNRLAELYMRKSKSGRFFDIQRDNKSKTMSSFPIPDEKGLDSIKKALEIYERIIKNFPKFEEFDSVLFNSAFAMQQLGLKKQSENNYKRLIENFPKSKLITDTLIALGELLYDQANFKEAQIYFEKIENYPESKVYSYGLYKLAWTYYNQKKSDQAIKKLKEVIAKNPASDENTNKKGYYLRKEALRDLVLFIGEVFEAKELYSIFKEITTQDELGQCMFDMAKLYDAYSKLKDIHIFLNEFIEKETNNPYIVRSHLLLADTYETLKQRELVLQNFSKAAKLCETGSEWRVNQSEAEINKSCQVEFRRSSLEIAKKWWEIWQKNKLHKEFSSLTEKILRLILANEIYDEPDLKTRMALAELLFQNENFEESSENYNIVALKSKDSILSHESTYSALFAKEKSIEKSKSDIKLAQRKELVQRYLHNFPNGEYFASVSLKLGIIFYEEKNYVESLKHLTKLSENKKDLEIKTKAEDLILDIKNLEKKYSEVKDLSKKFLLETKDLARKLSLSKINEESHYFEIQEENKKNDKYTSAIKLYEFYKSHVNSELGKQAYLDSLNLLFKEGFYVDATSKGLEFLKAFPKYDKAIELQKEIVNSLVEIADLEKAAHLLIDLSQQEQKNKLIHLEAAADFFILEGKNEQARKIYNQLLLALSKDKRSAIFVKIKNTLKENEDKSEIDKIEKIILDQNIEPFVTELLTKKAQKLFDDKKYPECYELTLKILKRDSDSSSRAYARYLQGLIFEKELVNQSVKTSNEDKLGLIIQLKTERLDKAQTAFLGVTKMTTDKQLLLKAFEGIDRSLENYIQSINELSPPSTLSDSDKNELKKELEKLISPLQDKRSDYLKEIATMKADLIHSDLNWDSLSFTTAVPVNFSRKLNYTLLPLFLNSWPIENNEIKVLSLSDYSKIKNIDPKIDIKSNMKTKLTYFANLILTKKTIKANDLALSWLNSRETKNLGLYATTIISESESKYLKAQWLLEKLVKSNPENLNIYKYSQFRINYNTRPENIILEQNDLANISVKTNSSDYTFYQIFTSYKFKNYQQTIVLCQSLRNQRDLEAKKPLKDFVLPYCSDALATTGDLVKAEKELDLVPLKEWKNKEYYYLSNARINDLYKKSSETAKKFYDFANKESSSTDMKLWLSKKINFLQTTKLEN